MAKHEHDWYKWQAEAKAGWYRKCTTCGEMEFTLLEEGFE